jgi:two-component system CheB/CheR fusion protein
VAELPRDLPLAVVVAPQRGDRPADDDLRSVLAAHAAMPVSDAADAVELRAGHLYVVPRGVVLGVANGRFEAAPRPRSGAALLPADFFLRSLANYAGAGAIGVVMCGSEADGTVGLQEVKGAGGIAIAQDPRTAVNDGAPRSAITSGAVDLVLPPKGVARELVRLAAQSQLAVAASRAGASGDGDGDGDGEAGAASVAAVEHLARLFSIVRSATGVDFTHYKYPTIQRRLQRRMLLHKIDSLGDYVRHLKQHPAEVQALYHDLLIKVTRFFRDPDSFEAMAKKVFPAFVANRNENDPIRIWVPGCSTGEEPYSIAMALLEYLADRHAGAAVQIFATDVSERAVEQARAGSYPESIAADVSPERLRRFFTHASGKYQIAKSVRDLCVFARQDLTRDPPFSRLDLVVCRNVLIYLGPVLQKRLMHVFHYALKPSGFLMLGSAETTGLYNNLFPVADKRNRLYRKKSTSVSPRIFLGNDPVAAAHGLRLPLAGGGGDGDADGDRGGGAAGPTPPAGRPQAAKVPPSARGPRPPSAASSGRPTASSSPATRRPGSSSARTCRSSSSGARPACSSSRPPATPASTS